MQSQTKHIPLQLTIKSRTNKKDLFLLQPPRPTAWRFLFRPFAEIISCILLLCFISLASLPMEDPAEEKPARKPLLRKLQRKTLIRNISLREHECRNMTTTGYRWQIWQNGQLINKKSIFFSTFFPFYLHISKKTLPLHRKLRL